MSTNDASVSICLVAHTNSMVHAEHLFSCLESGISVYARHGMPTWPGFN